MRKKILRLCVLDEDRFGYDFIGEVRVPLKTLKMHETKNFSMYLEKRMGHVSFVSQSCYL